MNRLFLLLLIFFLTCGLVSAQDEKREPAPEMPRPQFGPELAKLSPFAGDFTTETKVEPNPATPKGETAKGRSKIKWFLDSAFLVIEEAIDFSIFGSYRGMGLMTYDKAEKQYFLSMFNNFGDHPSYKGNFAGDTLILEGQIPFEGGAFTQQVVWLPEGKKLKLWVRNNMGQGWIPVIEQTYMPIGKSSKNNKK